MRLLSPPPASPFEAIFADFFDHGGCHYLVVGDRLSGWVEVYSSKAGTSLGGSAGLVRHLRSFFTTFGVPEEISSDGGPEFTAGHTEDFLRLWGVKHRLSSVGFPQSNGRAEVAVKTVKRLLRSNTGPTGSLDHDRFMRAMLQLRNTPDPDCNLSPAEIIFGRPLRGTLSFVNRLEKFSNPHIRPLWRQAWKAKEQALRTRITRTTESLKAHSRPLRPLAIGEKVFIQNQQGTHPNKWDRSGVVVESTGHDQYRVKVHGSGRLTLRNRRFLRAYTPATPSIPLKLMPSPQPTGSADQHPSPYHQSPVNSQSHLRELSQPMTVGPRSIPTDAPPSTEGTSPTTANGIPHDRDVQDAQPVAVPAPQPPAPSPRPCRVRRPPKRYEPETGQWID